MSDKTILQVPLDVSLRDQALQTAENLGFSSLQAAIRVLLKSLIDQGLSISFGKTEKLSPKAEKRYAKMIKDYEEGKNIIHCETAEDLFKKLNEN